MDGATTGTYRVQLVTDETALLVDRSAVPTAVDDPAAVGRDAFLPIEVTVEPAPADSDPSADGGTEPPVPGNVVEATIEWDHETARLLEYDRLRDDRLYAADGITNLFETAENAWERARAAGDPVVSEVTYGTDESPNGVVYVFADDAGPERVFDRLVAGQVPIEPLVARAEAPLEDDRPRGLYLLDPAMGEFAVFYIVFDDEGILAETIRSTYGVTRE